MENLMCDEPMSVMDIQGPANANFYEIKEEYYHNPENFYSQGSQ